ncbi:MAG: hypothetical protein AMS15_07205 [Planctomycetes bacterium DG_23]|nr:MAG: hypothetical protein AMS15_07205 [Planctomycetes bacterium DG_23]
MRIFGPILANELRRLTRRKRTFILRGVYLLMLFAIVIAVSYIWVGQGYGPTQISDLGVAIFQTFALVQCAAVLLLAPPLTAGTIAEEKDRGTLGLLFATGLSYGEIIRGKLTSRLALLGMLLFAGIPVMSLSLVFGGVSLWQIVAAFFLIATAAIFAASVSIFFSTVFQKAYSANIGGYLVIFGYMVGIPWMVEAVSSPWYSYSMADFLYYVNPLVYLEGCLTNDFGGADPLASGIFSIFLSLLFSWAALALSVRLLPVASFWRPGVTVKRFLQDVDKFFETIDVKRIRFSFGLLGLGAPHLFPIPHPAPLPGRFHIGNMVMAGLLPGGYGVYRHHFSFLGILHRGKGKKLLGCAPFHTTAG